MSIIVNIKPEAQEELGAAKKLTTGQFGRTLKELAQFSMKIPLLPDEAFTREGLYQDHD